MQPQPQQTTPQPSGPTPPGPPAGSGGKPGRALFVIGIVLLLAAVRFHFLVEGYDPDAPTCGDDKMSPGDVCMGTDGGDFEEMQAQDANSHEINTWIRTVGFTVGPVFLVLAVVQRIRVSRRARGPRPQQV